MYATFSSRLKNAETVTFLNTLTAPVSPATEDLLDYCISWSKAEGVWDKTLCWYAINETIEATYLNIRSPGQFTLTPSGSVEFSARKYVKGDPSSNAYLDTGFNLATNGPGYSQDNGHIGAYVRNDREYSPTGVIWGLNTSVGAETVARFFPLVLAVGETRPRPVGRHHAAIDNRAPPTFGTSGHWLLNRTDAASYQIWRGPAENPLAIPSAPSTSLPSKNILIFRSNTTYGHDEVSIFRIGKKLTDSEVRASMQIDRFWLQEIGALS